MSRRPEDSYILEKIKSYGDENFYRYVEMALNYYKQDVREGKAWIKANLPDLIRLNKENEKLRAALKQIAETYNKPTTSKDGLAFIAAAALKETE